MLRGVGAQRKPNGAGFPKLQLQSSYLRKNENAPSFLSPSPLSLWLSERVFLEDSSKHLLTCLWHWLALERMDSFIFGNLPLLCLFDADIAPLQRTQLSPPPYKRHSSNTHFGKGKQFTRQNY